MKILLIVLGFLSALLIVIQMVMGVLMRNGEANAALRTAHFHSGSLMVLVSLAYIALSLAMIASRPGKSHGHS
jgi:cytochrome b561